MNGTPLARALAAALALCIGLVAQAPKAGWIVNSGTASSFAAAQNAGTDVVCALHADTITGLTCNNLVTDGTTETAFATVATIPAGMLANRTLLFNFVFGHTASGTPATTLFKLRYGGGAGTIIFTGVAVAPLATTPGISSALCSVTAAGAAGASTPLVAACSMQTPGNMGNTLSNVLLLNTNLSVTADTTTSKTLVMTVTYGAATAGNAWWLYAITPSL